MQLHLAHLKHTFNGKRYFSYEQLEEDFENLSITYQLSLFPDFVNFFRGHGRESYKLNSILTRNIDNSIILKTMDIELQEKFFKEVYRENVEGFEDFENPSLCSSNEKKWKVYFQAQHLGLKTRLMDWSYDWKIAIFFAVENNIYFGEDGHLWIFYCPQEWRYNSDRRSEYLHKDIFDISKPHMINPIFFLDKGWKKQIGVMRQGRQSGRFFINSYEKSLIPMEANPDFDKYLIKVIIDGASKEKIKSDLLKKGISSEWVYYKNNEFINDKIKIINDEVIINNGLPPPINRIKS